jgi:hypothetical protein
MLDQQKTRGENGKRRINLGVQQLSIRFIFACTGGERGRLTTLRGMASVVSNVTYSSLLVPYFTNRSIHFEVPTVLSLGMLASLNTNPLNDFLKAKPSLTCCMLWGSPLA